MTRLPVSLGVDRVVVGVLTVGDEALGAVDDPLVAATHGVGLHARDVRAGVGLGETERGQQRRFAEAAEILLLELLGGRERDWRGGQAVAGERCADTRASPGDLLLDDGPIEVAQAGTAVLRREMAVHEAELPGLFDDLAGPGALAVIFPGDWTDLFLGEVVRQFAHAPLLVGEREINHGGFSLNSRLTSQSMALRKRVPHPAATATPVLAASDLGLQSRDLWCET